MENLEDSFEEEEELFDVEKISDIINNNIESQIGINKFKVAIELFVEHLQQIEKQGENVP